VLLLLADGSLWSLQNQSAAEHPGSPSLETAPVSTAPADPAAPLRTRTPSPSFKATTDATTRSHAPAAGDAQAHDGEGSPIAAQAPAVPRDQRQARSFTSYARVAQNFARAYARPRPEVSGQRWWEKVAQLLSARVVDDYRGTDPASVPFTRVHGSAVVLPSDVPTDLLVRVRVRTDSGPYVVELETDENGIHVTRFAAEGPR
jgi:hypothetical protein